MRAPARSDEQRQLDAIERDLIRRHGPLQFYITGGCGLVVWGGISAFVGFWALGAVSGFLGAVVIAWFWRLMIVSDREHESRVRRLLQLRARVQQRDDAPLRSEIDAVVAEDLIAYRKRLTGNLFGLVVGVLVAVGAIAAGFLFDSPTDRLWFWGVGALFAGLGLLATGLTIRKAVVGPREREARIRRFLQPPASSV
jgi:phosphate/sulfate permease